MHSKQPEAIWQSPETETGFCVSCPNPMSVEVVGPNFCSGNLYSFDELDQICKDSEISEQDKTWMKETILLFYPDFPQKKPSVKEALNKLLKFCDDNGMEVVVI